MERKNIDIIGAGINGISTGVALQLAGHTTKIHSAMLPFDLSDRRDRISAVATDFGAASVIPHTVAIDDLELRMAVSQAVFRLLSGKGNTGVGWRRHYEVFERQVGDPDYADLVDEFQRFPDSGIGIEGAPSLEGNEGVWGWTFKCLFADTPVYLKWLYALYERLGGEMEIKNLTREKIAELTGDAIINCSGYGSSKLFPELYGENGEGYQIVRGYLVHLPTPELQVPKNRDGLLTSYNYTPAPDRGFHDDDVYFYPRSSDIVLGGTRLRGNFDADGGWIGEEPKGPVIEISGESIPEGVVTINRLLIEQLTGIDIEQLDKSAACGYRFSTSKVRLEAGQNIGDRPLIHNVGHGGAGVTLSWGCADRVVELVNKSSGDSHDPNGLCRNLDIQLSE